MPEDNEEELIAPLGTITIDLTAEKSGINIAMKVKTIDNKNADVVMTMCAEAIIACMEPLQLERALMEGLISTPDITNEVPKTMQ
jgi:hypothetical protein